MLLAGPRSRWAAQVSMRAPVGVQRLMPPSRRPPGLAAASLSSPRRPGRTAGRARIEHQDLVDVRDERRPVRDDDRGHAFVAQPLSAWASAISPAPSRLEFGSSSTTSRGSPYSARARAMRWRCPGDRRDALLAHRRVVALGQAEDHARARSRACAAAMTASESTLPRRAMLSATLPSNSSTSWGT